MGLNKIDVLAVFHTVEKLFPLFANIEGLHYAICDIHEAREAVAELIEAATAVYNGSDPDGDGEYKAPLRAALIRCGVTP